MASAITLKLLLATKLLVLHAAAAPPTWGAPLQRPPSALPPLCASQFALVNRACSVIPYTPVPPLPPPSPPLPPPPPPGPPGPESDRHHHHHHHGHHHHHRTVITREEEECCRWLREVDSVCVCDLLVRLPPFLTRPVHNYTVEVNAGCNVTYRCSSRLVRG